jgi:hypothetical protein
MGSLLAAMVRSALTHVKHFLGGVATMPALMINP